MNSHYFRYYRNISADSSPTDERTGHERFATDERVPGGWCLHQRKYTIRSVDVTATTDRRTGGDSTAAQRVLRLVNYKIQQQLRVE